MSKLDEELRQALAQTESEGSDAEEMPSVAAPTTTPEQPSRQRQLGLLIAVLAMGGAVLGLVFSGSNDGGMVYSLDVDKALEARPDLEDRNLRVQGYLVSGTLVKRDEPCEYRFKVHKNGKELDVHFPQCVVPDTFRDVKGVDVEVTAEGRFADAGYLAATSIFAKCPSKYDMQQQAASGIKAPHGDKPDFVPPQQM